MSNENQTERFTDADTVKEAATSAIPEVLNPEVAKEQLSDAFSTTNRAAENLFEAVTNDLVMAVAKLKTVKSKEDRATIIGKVSDLQSRLETILNNFL